VVLLVAAAPCALVMSMPVAMATGIGSAGRRGILIKGDAHLEHLGTIRPIAFDKTGALTHGEPAVTDVVTLDGPEEELLAIAATLERYSEHPLARVIVAHARAAGVPAVTVEDFEALAGAKAKIANRTGYIGNPALFERLGAGHQAAEARIAALQEQGKTVVLVGNEDGVRGLLALQDRVRAGAKETIVRLHALGLRTAMLTGNNARTARAVARALGLDDVRADLKPEDKVAAVRQLEKLYGAVLMVGDGVNDAPALAAATCGIAWARPAPMPPSRRPMSRSWPMISPRSRRRCVSEERRGASARKTSFFRFRSSPS
jgi:Cd2+/Zn2+-exporting ATPase